MQRKIVMFHGKCVKGSHAITAKEMRNNRGYFHHVDMKSNEKFVVQQSTADSSRLRLKWLEWHLLLQKQEEEKR